MTIVSVTVYFLYKYKSRRVNETISKAKELKLEEGFTDVPAKSLSDISVHVTKTLHHCNSDDTLIVPDVSMVLAQAVNEVTPEVVHTTTSPAPTPTSTSSPTMTYSTFVEKLFSSVGLTAVAIIVVISLSFLMGYIVAFKRKSYQNSQIVTKRAKDLSVEEGLTKLVEVKDIESVVKTTRSDSVVSTDIFVKTERSDSVATMFNYSNDTLVIPEVHKFF
ncbi:hypothetical protein HDV02_000627 [Globomyces sp. JEL0801]|nr:hypothetical protein HDV02_000627 [Globomyces sp. JEL0801]